MVRIRFSMLVLLLALAASQSCSARQGREVQEHFERAQQDQQQGLLDSAAREYQAVIRLDPGMPEAYINLGLVYYAQAKFENSARVLASANKLKPGLRGVSLWLGIDSIKLNRPVEGTALLREAIRIDPTDKLAPLWLGTALWNSGQINASLGQLKKAAERFPDDADLTFAASEAYNKASDQQIGRLLEESAGTGLSDLIYGNIYADEGDWTKAEGHLRRAIERDPKSLEARLALAHVELEQGHVNAAKERLDDAITLAPRSASALAVRGELLLLTKEQNQGLSKIEEALRMNAGDALDALGLPVHEAFSSPSPSASLLKLCLDGVASLQTSQDARRGVPFAVAALYVLAGDMTSAKEAYEKADFTWFDFRPAVDLIDKAGEAMQQHRYEDAEAQLLRWLEAHTADRRAQYQLALARRQISMVHFAHLMLIAPNSYQVHQMLGELYVSREEDDKALAEYRAVVAERPDLPGVHFWLGHLYWKHGDAEHALVELEKELELSPGHAEANGELGAVLLAEDRTAEAIPHLQSAIRSKPDLWPAYSQLGRAYAAEKNYLRAEELLKRALSHDQDGSANYQLGLVFRSEGKSVQAAEAFEKVRMIKREKMAAPLEEDDVEAGAKR